MKLDFIAIGNIDDCAVNMRHGRKAPDVTDILPTVRKRGIIVPVIVRPSAAEDRFELVAGRRRVQPPSARHRLARRGSSLPIQPPLAWPLIVAAMRGPRKSAIARAATRCPSAFQCGSPGRQVGKTAVWANVGSSESTGKGSSAPIDSK